MSEEPTVEEQELRKRAVANIQILAIHGQLLSTLNDTGDERFKTLSDATRALITPEMIDGLAMQATTTPEQPVDTHQQAMDELSKRTLDSLHKQSPADELMVSLIKKLATEQGIEL